MPIDKSVGKLKGLLKKKKITENPLINGFLENDEYFALFEKAILVPSEENKNKVEEVFKSYYEKIRINAYFNNLIKYYAIDFDKKVRKINHRFALTLDKPVGAEETEIGTLKDFLTGNMVVEETENDDKTLREEISNEILYKALEVLTETQYKVLDLIYVKNLTKKEVANLVNSSPQNVSNIHSKAIKKLKNSIGGGQK